MAQAATQDIKTDVVERLSRPPYRAAAPDARSPDALPFLAAVGDLARNGWALDVERGPDGREYVVAGKKRGRAQPTGAATRYS